MYLLSLCQIAACLYKHMYGFLLIKVNRWDSFYSLTLQFTADL